MKKEKSFRQMQIQAALMDGIKHLAVPVIILVLGIIMVLTIIKLSKKEAGEPPLRINGYEGGAETIVLENDKLKLSMDTATTQLSVEVKSTGKVWYSNPEDLENETGILETEKDKLRSTLFLTYSEQAGLKTTYNSYAYSIKNGIYDIETGADYIKVSYSLGDVEPTYYIPPVTTEALFKEWCDKFSVEDKNLVQQYYKKYDINKLSKKDKEIKDELLAKYPSMADGIIYVLRDTTSKNVKIKIEQVFQEAGYSMEDYEADKELDLGEKSSDELVFNATVIYRLQGDEFIVEVPYENLEFPEKYPIYSVSVLPYFGAGGRDDEGYIFVPEGGGALIRFNNGKTAQNSYAAKLYGWDMGISRKELVHSTRAYFNTFGIANGDDSFICLLEEGAPYATVQADVAGKTHDYNFANVEYSVCSREKYDVGDIANSDIYVYQEELPDETMIQKYHFIDSNSYVDMANNYRQYLVDKYGSYLTMNTDTKTPVAVDIVGAVDKVKQVLGVPVSKPLELTNFGEAAEILNRLVNEDGMTNLSVKLTGWCNGGVKQKIMKSVKPLSVLGGASELKKLISTADTLGVNLYLNGITHYEYNSNIFNGFISYVDAAKKISEDRAELFVFSDVTFAAREGVKSYYLLHTDLANKMMDNLVSAANKYNAGVSFQDTGMDLSSDFYKKNYNSRYSVMLQHQEKLKELSDSGMKVMINMGNDYALPYADMITNMDLKGSEYTILDETVPFYEIAIHGFVDYTGFPINISGDDTEQVLRCAEYGAGLMFTLMDETPFALQKTLYTEYYGADINAWHDRMVKIYNRYDSELGHTFNQRMVGHENITPELSCTEYADGTKVYVNYSYEAVQSPDGQIPARDYKVVR